MEIAKVVKPFIRSGWPNTFGNIVYISVCKKLVIMYLHKEELGVEEGMRMSVWQVWVRINLYILFILVGGVTISWASADSAVTTWSAWTTLELHSSLKLVFMLNRKGWPR